MKAKSKNKKKRKAKQADQDMELLEQAAARAQAERLQEDEAAATLVNLHKNTAGVTYRDPPSRRKFMCHQCDRVFCDEVAYEFERKDHRKDHGPYRWCRVCVKIDVEVFMEIGQRQRLAPRDAFVDARSRSGTPPPSRKQAQQEVEGAHQGDKQVAEEVVPEAHDPPECEDSHGTERDSKGEQAMVEYHDERATAIGRKRPPRRARSAARRACHSWHVAQARRVLWRRSAAAAEAEQEDAKYFEWLFMMEMETEIDNRKRDCPGADSDDIIGEVDAKMFEEWDWLNEWLVRIGIWLPT